MEIKSFQWRKAVALMASLLLIAGLFVIWKQYSKGRLDPAPTTEPDNRLRDLRDDSNLPPQAPQQKKNDPPKRTIPRNDRGLIRNIEVTEADELLQDHAYPDSLWEIWYHQDETVGRLPAVFGVCAVDFQAVLPTCLNLTGAVLANCMQRKIASNTSLLEAIQRVTANGKQPEKVMLELKVNRVGVVTEVYLWTPTKPGGKFSAPDLAAVFPELRPAIRQGQPVESVLFIQLPLFPEEVY
jgi:hypothetical protein